MPIQWFPGGREQIHEVQIWLVRPAVVWRPEVRGGAAEGGQCACGAGVGDAKPYIGLKFYTRFPTTGRQVFSVRNNFEAGERKRKILC